MPVQPTGEKHHVDVEDLFFSTTDRKGVITLANIVFATYARWSDDQLIGAPHNIIRHPMMPGGVFRIIWRMLQAGQTTCGYVLNLAGDGSEYWTFATLTPLGENYISVRSAPGQPELLAALQGIYTRVREQEQQARAAGRTAAQTAELGEELFLQELDALGFGSYEDFLRVVVPAELVVRDRQGLKVPERTAATGMLRRLRDHVVAMHGHVGALSSDLAPFESVAHRLRGNAEGAQTAVRSLKTVLEESGRAIEALEGRAPLLVSAAPALRTQCDRIAERLGAVAERVTGLRDGRSQLRFSVAVAQLQAEMMARYAVAVIDGKEDGARSDQAIRALIASVDEGLQTLVVDLDANGKGSSAIIEEIESAASVLRIATMTFGKWRSLVDKYDLSTLLADEVTRVDEALGAIDKHLQGMSQDAKEFATATVSFDLAALDEELKQAMRLAGYIRTSPASGRTVSYLDRLLGR